MIRALIIDRDGVINHASSDANSPLYYILKPKDIVIKPSVREAFEILGILRRNLGLKVYLATKQKCISKGFISRDEVNDINHFIEQLIGFSFNGIYVEESEDNKKNLFEQILKDSGCSSSEIIVIDNSETECSIARDVFRDSKFGGLLSSKCSGDLYKTVTKIFSIE